MAWDLEILSLSTCHSVWQEIVEDLDSRGIKLSSFVEFSTPRGFLHVKLCLSHLWFIVNLLVHISEFVMLWIIECYSLLKLSLSLSKSYMVSELFTFILKTYMVSEPMVALGTNNFLWESLTGWRIQREERKIWEKSLKP